MRSSAGASSAAAQTVHPGAARAASAVAAHADPRPGAQAAPLSLAATSFAPPSEPAGDSRPGVAAAPLPLKASVPPAAVPDREFAARHGASTALPAEATAAAAMTAPMSRLPNATREHASPQLVWRKSAVTGGAPAGAATGLAEAIARQRRSGDPVIARETGTDSAGSSSESGVSPSQAAAGVSAESAPDLQALAERVGQLLQRRLEVERERRGLRKWR